MFENVAKDMALAMYASMVRGIVLYHAQHLKLLTTYGAIANSTKVLPRGGQLAQAIALITEDDHKNKRPLSTAVVVNAKTKRPGSGFFDQCRRLGFKVGGTEEEEIDFWFEQLFRLDVQPVTLEGFEMDLDNYPLENMGTLDEVRGHARFSAANLNDRWGVLRDRLRNEAASSPTQPEVASVPCSGLPGA